MVDSNQQKAEPERLDVRELHHQAMALADQAENCRRCQNDWVALLVRASELEAKAAKLTSEEPTRSVLYRSAAELSLEAGRPREAMELALTGIAGDGVPDFAVQELRDVHARAGRLYVQTPERPDVQVLEHSDIRTIPERLAGITRSLEEASMAITQALERPDVQTPERLPGQTGYRLRVVAVLEGPDDEQVPALVELLKEAYQEGLREGVTHGRLLQETSEVHHGDR